MARILHRLRICLRPARRLSLDSNSHGSNQRLPSSFIHKQGKVWLRDILRSRRTIRDKRGTCLSG